MDNNQPPGTPTGQGQYQQPQPQYPPQPQYQPQTQQVYSQAQIKYGRGVSRIIPGLVIAVLAIALLVVGIAFINGKMKTNVQSAIDVNSALSSAKTTFDANNGTTDTAPQQAVANGWYTNDLLIVTAQAVYASNNTEQKVLDSNKTLSIVLVVSVGVLLLAFGAFFVLKAALD
jgi:hypothetical protein